MSDNLLQNSRPGSKAASGDQGSLEETSGYEDEIFNLVHYGSSMQSRRNFGSSCMSPPNNLGGMVCWQLRSSLDELVCPFCHPYNVNTFFSHD